MTRAASLALPALACLMMGCQHDYRWNGLDLSSGRRLHLAPQAGIAQHFDGHYLSPQLGELRLEAAEGASVHGSYRYQRGAARVYGSLNGTVEGNLLRFDWRETHTGTGAPTCVLGSGHLLLGPAAQGTSGQRLFGRLTTHIWRQPGGQGRSFPSRLEPVRVFAHAVE